MTAPHVRPGRSTATTGRLLSGGLSGRASVLIPHRDRQRHSTPSYPCATGSRSGTTGVLPTVGANCQFRSFALRAKSAESVSCSAARSPLFFVGIRRPRLRTQSPGTGRAAEGWKDFQPPCKAAAAKEGSAPASRPRVSSYWATPRSGPL